MTGQLDLFAEAEVSELPIGAFGPFQFGTARDESERHDHTFPLECLAPVKTKNREFSITLRAVEDGVWLWGVNWAGGRGDHSRGGGFHPFRKWGAKFAATTRQSAIQNATEYALKNIEACR